MKSPKPLLKEKIFQLSALIKQKISGPKSVQALIFLAFMHLVKVRKTKKYLRLKNLSHWVLKQKLRRFGSKLLKEFSLQEFLKDFKFWTAKSDSYKSKHRVKARIDTTKSGRKYGKRIPELERLYDYVNKHYIKTHELYVFLISINRKDYIVDFVLMKKSRRIGSNAIAQKLIESFLKLLGPLAQDFRHYVRFSLDGGFGNGEMLKYFSKKRFQYVALKSAGKDMVWYDGNRQSLTELKDRLIRVGKFKDYNAKHNLNGLYCAVTGHLESQDMDIRVVLRKLRGGRGKKSRYLTLLSPITGAYDYQISQCYKDRWGIEECIKECKQVVDLTSYSYHTKGTTRNIETFLALRFCCYMILNWYRVECCRPSKTSLWKVAECFRDYFGSISYKALWNIFFPSGERRKRRSKP